MLLATKYIHLPYKQYSLYAQATKEEYMTLHGILLSASMFPSDYILPYQKRKRIWNKLIVAVHTCVIIYRTMTFQG